MTTRFVGLKEFRKQMAKFSNDAARLNQRLVVLRKNVPLFELRPLSKEDRVMDGLLLEVEDARKDVKKKRTYSLAQVEKSLGL